MQSTGAPTVNIFETIVAKITMANEICRNANPAQYDHIYHRDKIPDNCKIYTHTSGIGQYAHNFDRELKKAWIKLSANHKIYTIINFLKDVEERHPNVCLNIIRYEALLNIDANKGLDLKIDYDSSLGKINRIYGYTIEQNKIIKTDNFDDYISNKIKLILKFKKTQPDEH